MYSCLLVSNKEQKHWNQLPDILNENITFYLFFFLIHFIQCSFMTIYDELDAHKYIKSLSTWIKIISFIAWLMKTANIDQSQLLYECKSVFFTVIKFLGTSLYVSTWLINKIFPLHVRFGQILSKLMIHQFLSGKAIIWPSFWQTATILGRILIKSCVSRLNMVIYWF